MSADEEEHSESEFYYPTEDSTLPSIDRNDVLAPRRAVGGGGANLSNFTRRVG